MLHIYSSMYWLPDPSSLLQRGRYPRLASDVSCGQPCNCQHGQALAFPASRVAPFQVIIQIIDDIIVQTLYQGFMAIGACSPFELWSTTLHLHKSSIVTFATSLL